MKPLEINTHLQNGKIPPVQRDRIANYLKDLWEGNVHIYVSDKRRAKSKKQRGFYFGVILPIICNFTGDSINDMHELMKKEFLTVEFNGEKKVLSTESLNKTETAAYYKQVIFFWQQKGVVFPTEDSYNRGEIDDVNLDMG